MKALRRLTQEHYMEEGVIIVDIRTFLRLYVQKKILGTRANVQSQARSILYDWCVLYLASQVTDLCDDESECF